MFLACQRNIFKQRLQVLRKVARIDPSICVDFVSCFPHSTCSSLICSAVGWPHSVHWDLLLSSDPMRGSHILEKEKKKNSWVLTNVLAEIFPCLIASLWRESGAFKVYEYAILKTPNCVFSKIPISICKQMALAQAAWEITCLAYNCMSFWWES